MFTEVKKRKYTKTRRAVQQARTRARIVDALLELHQEIGPAKTTVKAIAERAGVERLTVYRYFPDTACQLQACSSRYFELHPPPQKHEWQSRKEPLERIRLALKIFYRYYRQTAAIFHHSYRDADDIPEVHEILDGFENYLDEVTRDLLQELALTPTASKAVRNTLRHGLGFSSWESLERLGLVDAEKAKLVTGWICGAALPVGKRSL